MSLVFRPQLKTMPDPLPSPRRCVGSESLSYISTFRESFEFGTWDGLDPNRSRANLRKDGNPGGKLSAELEDEDEDEARGPAPAP